MKNHLIVVVAFLAFTNTRAQGMWPTEATSVTVTDTVHYFFNKHYLKLGPQSLVELQNYKSAPITNTEVSHVGSKFENSEPIEIYGLEAFMKRHEVSTFTSISVRLYLCTLQNNMPVLPAIDSVEVLLTDTFYSVPRGGRFPKDKVYTMTQDFAVLIRNASDNSGDTVRVMRTSGKPPTNNQVPWNEKFGEGFGYVRYAGQFYGARDFTLAPGFGTGTDYEFCVAPMVQYTLVSSHLPDAAATNSLNGLCAYDPVVYKSLSSKRFLHRQYNLLAFHSYWKFFSDFAPATASNVFPNDSAILWFFQPADRANHDARRFLRYDSPDQEITVQFDSVYFKPGGGDSIHCFDANFYRTRFKSMRMKGTGWFKAHQDSFLICTEACGRIHPGLQDVDQLAEIRVFPNPVSNVCHVRGLLPGSLVSVFDLNGRLVARQVAGTGTVTIHLARQLPGVYLLHVSEGYQAKTFRVVKE